MNQGPKKVLIEALETQLEVLKSRLKRPDAAYWRQMGKLAQDFTVWLERARPFIPCASTLIALRVEQVMGEVDFSRANPKALRKLSDLLNEASRQLSQPGSPIQVIDLEREEITHIDSEPKSCFTPGGAVLPSDLIAIPEILRPEGNLPIQFRYLIPN